MNFKRILIMCFLLGEVFPKASAFYEKLDTLNHDIQIQRQSDPFSEERQVLAAKSAQLLDCRNAVLSKKSMSDKERKIVQDSIIMQAVADMADPTGLKSFKTHYQTPSSYRTSLEYGRHLMAMAHVYYYTKFCIQTIQQTDQSLPASFNNYNWGLYIVYAHAQFKSEIDHHNEIFFEYLSNPSLQALFRSRDFHTSFFTLNNKKYLDTTWDQPKGHQQTACPSSNSIWCPNPEQYKNLFVKAMGSQPQRVKNLNNYLAFKDEKNYSPEFISFPLWLLSLANHHVSSFPRHEQENERSELKKKWNDLLEEIETKAFHPIKAISLLGSPYYKKDYLIPYNLTSMQTFKSTYVRGDAPMQAGVQYFNYQREEGEKTFRAFWLIPEIIQKCQQEIKKLAS